MCDSPFSKEGTIYLLVLCFAMPVLVNGFCHINIAKALVKSMRMENQLRDKLVLQLNYLL